MAVGIEYCGFVCEKGKKTPPRFPGAALSGHPMGFVVDTVQGPPAGEGSLGGAGSLFFGKAQKRRCRWGEGVVLLRTK